MPYILPERREVIATQVGPLLERIENALEGLAAPREITSGDMNYLVTLLVHEWSLGRKKNYANLSQARAVLQDAADEFYRTVVGPYEDEKAIENGKVTGLDTRVLR